MRPTTSPFKALQFRNYRFFWLSLMVVQIVRQMQIVGINWHVYQLTHSAVSLGIIGIAGFIPVLLLALPSGIIADKIDRKKIMLAGQCALVLSSLMLFATTKSNTISPLILYAAVFLNAIVLSFDLPARQSVVPSLVPDKVLINAVSLVTIVYQASMVVGPSIAGFTIEFLGMSWVYLFGVIFFFVSLIALSFVHIPKVMEAEKISLGLKSVLEGIHFVRKTPIIYANMLLDFFATFFSSATVLLPIFAQDILGVGTSFLGLLYAAPSVGAIIAGIVFSSYKNISNQGKILIVSVVVYGAATIAFGLSKSVCLSLLFLALLGAGDMINTILRNTIRQLATPNHLRGRMVSINMIFFLGGPYLGEAEAGIVAGLVGAPLSVVIGGVGTIIAAAVLAATIPILRKYDTHTNNKQGIKN